MPRAKTAPETIPIPAANDFRRFLAREQKRLALQRQAADLEKLSKADAARFLAFAKAKGARPGKPCNHVGFELALETFRASVAWKQEFVALHGEELAERIASEQPFKEKLILQKAA